MFTRVEEILFKTLKEIENPLYTKGSNESDFVQWSLSMDENFTLCYDCIFVNCVDIVQTLSCENIIKRIGWRSLYLILRPLFQSGFGDVSTGLDIVPKGR